MKKLMLSIAVLLFLGVGVTMNIDGAGASIAKVDTSVAHVQRVERRLRWSTHHIKKLNRRNDYLHRYIQHLRQQTRPTSTSRPTTTHTSSYSGGVLSDAQVVGYLRGAGFPESAIPTMLYYSHRESGNDPRAINASSGACGLWQLYPCYGGAAWLDPAVNAHFAHEKYLASGFAPWGG